MAGIKAWWLLYGYDNPSRHIFNATGTVLDCVVHATNYTRFGKWHSSGKMIINTARARGAHVHKLSEGEEMHAMDVASELRLNHYRHGCQCMYEVCAVRDDSMLRRVQGWGLKPCMIDGSCALQLSVGSGNATEGAQTVTGWSGVGSAGTAAGFTQQGMVGAQESDGMKVVEAVASQRMQPQGEGDRGATGGAAAGAVRARVVGVGGQVRALPKRQGNGHRFAGLVGGGHARYLNASHGSWQVHRNLSSGA